LNPRSIATSDYKLLVIESFRYLQKGFFNFFLLAALNTAIIFFLAKYFEYYAFAPLIVILAPYIDATYTKICLGLKEGKPVNVLSILINNSWSNLIIGVANFCAWLALLVATVVLAGIFTGVIVLISYYFDYNTSELMKLTNLTELAALASNGKSIMLLQINSITMLPFTVFLPQLCVYSGIELTKNTILAGMCKSKEGLVLNIRYWDYIFITTLVISFSKFEYVNLVLIATLPLLHSIFKFAVFKAIYLGDMNTVFEKKVVTTHVFNGC